MSMILLCESEYDLSGFYESFFVIKCSDISTRTAKYFDVSKLWTIDFDFFDEMVTDAHHIWSRDPDSRSVLLTEFLDKFTPLCSQIAMFWVSFDKESMVCFDDGDKFIKYVKETIISDYKCMFNCWYRKTN